jgi:hypothetical protein
LRLTAELRGDARHGRRCGGAGDAAFHACDAGDAAAAAGKHVYCEKPFTLTKREAEDAVAAVRKAGVTLASATTAASIRR